MSSQSTIKTIGERVIPEVFRDRFNQFLEANKLPEAARIAQKWMRDAVNTGRIKEEEVGDLLTALDKAQAISGSSPEISPEATQTA